ncbi:MAG: hypothetical protein ACJ8DI_22430 [Ktedonobacteraceae bacterium]
MPWRAGLLPGLVPLGLHRVRRFPEAAGGELEVGDLSSESGYIVVIRRHCILTALYWAGCSSRLARP